jgi:hypothetical protein
MELKQAIEVFLQLAEHGVVWDGDLVSKAGRDLLIEHGLAEKEESGNNILTKSGVDLAWRYKIEHVGR